MYTIGEAANRSGVPVNTIRAWERRYGVIRPARTASGYRLYDDEAVRTLDLMRRLVAEGWQPSVAAAELHERGLRATAALLSATTPTASAQTSPPAQTTATPWSGPSQGGTALPDPLISGFVDAAARLDEAQLASVLDEAFARGSFERAATDFLFPALEALGQAWAAGDVSVAGEHLASEAVARRLGMALDAAGRPAVGPGRILVGLPPAARHELGALAFAVAARRASLPVTYLGADLPVDDWLSAARQARAAVIGVPTLGDRPSADQVIDRLRADAEGVAILVGGAGATAQDGVTRLPDQLDEAVQGLRLALGPR